MGAVACERGSHFTRGYNRGDLTGKILVSWKGGRLWEVVAHGGSTVILTVKSVQAYLPRFHEWIFYSKVASIGRCRNQYQIQICIPACVMSSAFFKITSLYSVRLSYLLNGQDCFKDIYIKFKKLSWKKFHNYPACEFTAHYACRNAGTNISEIYNYQRIQHSTINE